MPKQRKMLAKPYGNIFNDAHPKSKFGVLEQKGAWTNDYFIIIAADRTISMKAHGKSSTYAYYLLCIALFDTDLTQAEPVSTNRLCILQFVCVGTQY